MKPIHAPPPTRLQPPVRHRETLIRLVSDLLRMSWQKVDARHYLNDYRASEWLPPTPLHELQLAKLRRLVWHCFLHVPFYAARIRLPPSRLERLDGLAELPAVSADERRRDPDPFRAQSGEAVAAERFTAGTRGRPARVLLDGDALERRLAVRLRAERWAGAPPDRLFAPWGEETVRVAHRPEERELAALCRELMRARGAVVAGPAAALGALADELGRGQRPSRWRALVRGAELELHGVIVTGPDDGGGARLAALSRSARLSRWYQTAEVGLIAASCDRAPSERALHVQADHLLLEVLSDAGEPLPPGATGRLHVTDLHNYAAPYLRQDLGDRGRLVAAPCACGRALPLLELD